MKTRKPKPSRSSISRRVAAVRASMAAAQGPEVRRVFASLDEGDPNPFDLLTPTKNNFASIAEAIDYYQIRVDVCVKASALLKQAAHLCLNVVRSTARTAEAFSKLRAADLDGFEVPPQLRPAALRALNEQLSPMVDTFAEAASAYEAQGDLLLRTVAALRRGVLEVVK